jgi:signal transduction histidine kinase
MNPGSIRLRLLIAAAVAVIVALAIAGTGLIFLFERHVERRVARELTDHLNQLIAATSVAPDGTLSVAGGLSDPRFSTPLSGLYWEVDTPDATSSIRSRSLWESTLALGPTLPVDGALHTTEVAGPEAGRLFVVERLIHDASGKTFRVAVAEDHRSVEVATGEFAAELVPSLALLAAVLILAMWLQVTVGLKPLERLRRAVSNVVTGNTARLEATVPTEVQPLADEINRLLDSQAKALVRARSGATDLAHGLKTPLQVLSGDIRKLREKGEAQIADEIDTVAASIRRHVDRELARVRVAPAAAAQTARSDVAAVAARVIAVVKRTPQGERLTFAIDAPPALAATIDESDLAEILGNLIENAARYAKAEVRVGARECGGATRIIVTDDGPGIPDQAHAAALARGVRLDTAGGTGLGLAIVADVVDAYGGQLDIGNAQPGLSVTVTLPHRHNS